MNLHLYQVYDLTDINDYGESPMDCCSIMTDKDLREKFLWAYNNGKIPHELIDDYKADTDYSKENWDDMGNLRVGTMIDMLNDIVNYECGTGYYILETDVDVEIPHQMYEMLGEIQSICIGADSPDANTLGDQDPVKELQNCRADLSAISDITEQLQLMIGE